MKNIITIALAAFLLTISLSSQAQRPGKTWSAGFGVEAGIPTGNAGNAYTLAGGLSGRFSLLAGPGYATITAGWNVFVPKDIYGQNPQVALQIPIKAGYKYIIADHFFVMGELGYSMFTSYQNDYYGNAVSSSTGGFTYAPSVGVQFGVMEIGVRYESILVKNDDISFVGFRLGFNF